METPSAKKDYNIRVDFVAHRGFEEILPQEMYDLLDGDGIWIEEKGDVNVIKAYPSDLDAYMDFLVKSGIPVGDIVAEKEDTRDYSELTRRYFRPVRVEGVTILAPWNRSRSKGARIFIEPGMAFGTGRHESTRLMFRLMKGIKFKGKTVADLGCGSGILSLYAVVLGAESVLAVDNDPDAVRSTEENMALNNTGEIKVICTDLRHIEGAFDIVLANLDIQTFIRFSDHIKGLVVPGGYMVVSGILGRDRSKLMELFRPFYLMGIEKKNTWRGFLFRLSPTDPGVPWPDGPLDR